jgi:hypothetical protein
VKQLEESGGFNEEISKFSFDELDDLNGVN